MENLRNFEISIWTLQDRFITVLEDSYNKLKGKTQDATMTLNIDGTQELTFTIPMKFDVGDHYVTNPAWISAVDESQLLVNTRKIKVILNKKTEEEEIHEFVIDKVTERHENDQMYCDITCSGLAFYELGKIGYKISLTSEDFYADDLKWFYKEEENGERIFVEQPIANIQYWLNKFLTPLNNQDDIYSEENVYESFKWYYALQMDWTHYFNYPGWGHSKHKIYEDSPEYEEQFSAETNKDIVGAKVYREDGVVYKEKARLVDLEESNIYNLTQDIAEIFEVFCRYEYIYDDNYHIIGRVAVFYNSFLLDDNQLSITYRNQTSSITRETDSTDLVTKMYVKTVDENDDTISIIDVEDNPTGEDYILNFDYLHKIGTITDEQYEYVSEFSKNIKVINQQLKPLAEKINDLELKKIDAEARLATATAAKALDAEQVAAADMLFQSLTGGTGVIQVTAFKPEFCVLRNNGDGTYYINLTTQGIHIDTLQVYLNLTSNLGLDSRYKVENVRPEYDDFGNIVRLVNIVKPASINHNHAYLIYDYEPKLYYENIKNTWIRRQAKDIDDADKADKEVKSLESALKTAKSDYNTQLAAKKKELELFEEMMGPAIREGYWQPENYKDSGDTYVSNYTMHSMDIEEGNSGYDYFIWDTELIEGEQDISYPIGVEQNREYYNIIKLTTIWDSVKDKLDGYQFLFYDTDLTNDVSKLKAFSIGSQAFVKFIKNTSSNTIFPALVITGGENFNSETWDKIKSNGHSFIGKIVPTSEGTYEVQDQISINSSIWMKKNEELKTGNYKPCYPRIYVESLSMKNSDDQLAMSLGAEASRKLENFKDYYVTTRIKVSHFNPVKSSDDSYVQVPVYSITVKEPVLYANTSILNGTVAFNNRLSILFSLSNADSAIYNDALIISHESAYPQVSYEFNYDIFKNGCLKQPNKYLNHIVKVNDYELKFEGVRGYISGITAILDRPWEDTLEIKNYRTKFEDLFSNILAQTEAMKKNEHVIDYVSRAFGSDGQLQTAVVQKTLTRKDLNFAFNEGNLTIDEKNGIWGVSDSGVVAMRGGGIFTANEKDENENWIWNTGITPSGIDASSITTGQLDTNRISIYAGDKLRLQMNAKGLFAYKSFFEDFSALTSSSFNSADKNKAINRINGQATEQISDKTKYSNDIDAAQYVKFDENGLFLIAEKGALVLNEAKNGYKTIDNTVERVAISWNGLTLRNYNGDRTFYANANTGDLTLQGTIQANAGWFGGKNGWIISGNNNSDNTQTEGIIQSANGQVELKSGFFNTNPSIVFKNSSGDKVLAFENNTLTIRGNGNFTGIVHAQGGWFGNETNGWIIGEESGVGYFKSVNGRAIFKAGNSPSIKLTDGSKDIFKFEDGTLIIRGEIMITTGENTEEALNKDLITTITTSTIETTDVYAKNLRVNGALIQDLTIAKVGSYDSYNEDDPTQVGPKQGLYITMEGGDYGGFYLKNSTGDETLFNITYDALYSNKTKSWMGQGGLINSYNDLQIITSNDLILSAGSNFYIDTNGIYIYALDYSSNTWMWWKTLNGVYGQYRFEHGLAISYNGQ